MEVFTTYMDSFVGEPSLALPDHGQTMTEESWLSNHICKPAATTLHWSEQADFK